jgi:hypothetical protein
VTGGGKTVISFPVEMFADPGCTERFFFLQDGQVDRAVMIGGEEKIQKINGDIHRFFFEPHFNGGVAGKSLDGKPVGFIEFVKSSAEVRDLFDAPEVSQIEKKFLR